MRKNLKNTLPEKPYFPFFLGNGIDGVLLDYSGSMSCNSGHLHLEHLQGVVCAWYKPTWRSRERGVYPIIQSTYTLLANGGEAFEVGGFKQAFDPEEAVLTTTVEATEFRIRVETFLTLDHVLVERYRLDSVAKDRATVGLNLHPPFLHCAWLLHAYTQKMEHRFEADPENQSMTCDFTIGPTRGRAVLLTDYPQVQAEDFYQGKRLALTNLKKGMAFTKFVVLMDETNGADYAERIARTVERIRNDGYEKIRRRHGEEWAAYQSRSHVRLPDRWMEYLYRLSLYQLRAHQNPETGLISLGNYPPMWGGGVTNSWDLFTINKALLGANRVTEAEKYIAGYTNALPFARQYASELDEPGAYFAWFMDYAGKSLTFGHAKECPKIEKFNNGCLVMEAWDLYRMTGDKTILERNWPLIRETTEFLVANLVEEVDGVAMITEGEGADESIDRKNDSFHAITTIKALEAVVEGGKVLNMPVDPAYATLKDKLREGLTRNFRGKVLMPFLGANSITTQIFTSFVLNLPEGIPAAGIEKGLKVCRGEWGLTNPGTYRNLIWPWSECKAGTVLSYMKDPRGYEHLRHAAQFTSTLGAFPEKIRPDRFWIGFWYISAHGTYTWGINSMLAHVRGDRLRIFPGVPKDWKDVSFEQLRVEPGVLVSAKVAKGRLTRLVLENQTPQPVELNLDIPPRYLTAEKKKRLAKSIALLPGKSIRWT